MNVEEIALIAQNISFSYEDHFFDEKKRKLFLSFFNKYLPSVDPGGAMEPYDAIVQLGRQYPTEFEHMVKAMKEQGLISD